MYICILYRCCLHVHVVANGVRRQNNTQNPRENLYPRRLHTHTRIHPHNDIYIYIHSFTVIYTRLYEGDGACVCIVYYYTGPFTGQFGKAGNHNSPTREMLKAFPKSSRSCTHPPVDPPPTAFRDSTPVGIII